MTICSFCGEHVKRRFFISGKDYKALVNISPDQLRKMTIDELTEAYRNAENGSMACTDCIRLCTKGDASCTPEDIRREEASKHRITEDDRAMKAILKELDRRINIKKITEDMKRLKM